MLNFGGVPGTSTPKSTSPKTQTEDWWFGTDSFCKSDHPPNPFYLGGGFKYFFISTPNLWEMIQFDEDFSDGLKPPTSLLSQKTNENPPWMNQCISCWTWWIFMLVFRMGVDQLFRRARQWDESFFMRNLQWFGTHFFHTKFRGI